MTVFSRRGIAIFLALLVAGAGEAFAKKPKNPRRKKKAAAAAAAAKVKKKKEPPPPPPRDQLAPGRWAPEVKKAIDDLAWNVGKGTDTYDEAKPPVAVLPWSDGAIAGDLSEAVFTRMVEKVDFKFDDAFWRIVPLPYGRQSLRAAYSGFADEPQATWPAQAQYQQYAKGFTLAYQGICQRVGRRQCREFLARLFFGFKEDELKAYIKKAVAQEWARPVAAQSISSGAEDAAPAIARRGIRAVPEMKDLAAFLLRRGFDVWVVSDDGQGLLEEAVPAYGIDPSRAAGVRVKVASGTVTSEVLEPVPVGSGKSAALMERVGRVPALVVAGPLDVEFLSYGEGLRVLLDRGDESLRGMAADKGWRVQPAFPDNP